jgi:hypothetical protein
MKSSDYSYNRFGIEGQRVGQAVTDILSKEQPTYTVEDILDTSGQDFLKEVIKIADENKTKFEAPFHIFVLTNKDLGQFGVANVMRNKFVPRQTAPNMMDMMEQYSGSVKSLFEVNKEKGEITLLWCLPAYQDCLSILKTPNSYDPQLVAWIDECFKTKASA